jgi:hypothetical protein
MADRQYFLLFNLYIDIQLLKYYFVLLPKKHLNITRKQIFALNAKNIVARFLI